MAERGDAVVDCAGHCQRAVEDCDDDEVGSPVYVEALEAHHSPYYRHSLTDVIDAVGMAARGNHPLEPRTFLRPYQRSHSSSGRRDDGQREVLGRHEVRVVPCLWAAGLLRWVRVPVAIHHYLGPASLACHSAYSSSCLV